MQELKLVTNIGKVPNTTVIAQDADNQEDPF